MCSSDLAQIDYVQRFHGGRYEEMGHSELLVVVGDSFDGLQLRNVAYQAQMETVEEGTHDLDVGIREFTGFGDQQEVVHRLVDALSVEHEPERDRSKRRGDCGCETGFLEDFTDRRLLGCLPGFQVAFRERPDHAAFPVDASDDGGSHLLGIDDEAPRAGFVLPLASPLRPLPRAGHAPSVRETHTLAS